MNSCVYEGWVRHRRMQPVRHEFRYALALPFIDLDELDTAFRGSWLWSEGRHAVATIRRKDHFGDPRLSLKQAVLEWLSAEGVDDPIGSVRLLTQARYWGYLMNPVSFYFCYHAQNESLVAVIAEVRNTPWGERHCYLLRPEQFAARGPGESLEKRFHVSPFMPMNQRYRWRLAPPGESLTIDIENHESTERVHQATLQLERRPWSSANLRRLVWRYPMQTHRVALAIYGQALRLWWKGCTFHPHPKHHSVIDSAAMPGEVRVR
jgi:DUF1365 family protein